MTPSSTRSHSSREIYIYIHTSLSRSLKGSGSSFEDNVTNLDTRGETKDRRCCTLTYEGDAVHASVTTCCNFAIVPFSLSRGFVRPLISTLSPKFPFPSLSSRFEDTESISRRVIIDAGSKRGYEETGDRSLITLAINVIARMCVSARMIAQAGLRQWGLRFEVTFFSRGWNAG